MKCIDFQQQKVRVELLAPTLRAPSLLRPPGRIDHTQGWLLCLLLHIYSSAVNNYQFLWLTYVHTLLLLDILAEMSSLGLLELCWLPIHLFAFLGPFRTTRSVHLLPCGRMPSGLCPEPCCPVTPGSSSCAFHTGSWYLDAMTSSFIMYVLVDVEHILLELPENGCKENKIWDLGESLHSIHKMICSSAGLWLSCKIHFCLGYPGILCLVAPSDALRRLTSFLRLITCFPPFLFPRESCVYSWPPNDHACVGPSA